MIFSRVVRQPFLYDEYTILSIDPIREGYKAVDTHTSFAYYSPHKLGGAFYFDMARSLYKGPYLDPTLIKKIVGKKPHEAGVIRTWARRSQISPEMVGFKFGVHNGRSHAEVLVTEEMVGHRLGEFSPTKKFIRHGGRIQKETEMKQKEAEIAAAKAASAASTPAPAK